MTPGTAELTKIAIRSSVENVRGVGKQPAHPLQHRAVLRPGEAGVALEQTACSGLGLLEQAEVPRQIGQCQLWQAVLTDFDAGTIGTRYLFEDQDRRENTCEADLDFSFYLTEPDSMVHRGGSVAITLTPQASHTLALLHELKVLDETHLALTNREAEALELGEGGAYAPSTQAEAVIEGYDF
mgnify:CR=1 FL=1